MKLHEQVLRLERVYKAIDKAREWIVACDEGKRLQNCPEFWDDERKRTIRHLNSLRKTLARVKRDWRGMPSPRIEHDREIENETRQAYEEANGVGA